ncbi:MAG: caspase family protein [Pseudomonadota bacterium]
MRHFLISSFLVIALLIAGGHDVLAKRVALVIGNDDYQDVIKLQKAGNDAKAMADALTSVGFEVVSATNLVRREMNFQLQTFYSKLEPGDEALFFYAGHGIEIAGRNYLLPTDIPSAKPGREDFIRSEAIPVDEILRSIRQRSTRVSILILDACRDNPFPSEGTRSLGGSRGLARMPSPEGTFIMYSAGVGQTALDRLSDDDPHPNSVFTRNLVPLIKKPGVSLTRTARTVRRQVQQLATKVSHNQRPAYYDEVTGDFFFAGKSQEAAAGGQPQAPKPSTSIDREALFWSSVKDSTSPAIIGTYLRKFPKGQFAELARLKIAELQANADPPPSQPASPPQPPKKQVVAAATPPSTPVTPPAAKPQVERVQLTATVWPIGKWPEGITSDGQNLWIAESGVRRVAQMDAQNGRIIKRVKVGRLPVNMAANRSGQVFSLVHTDALVWSLPPRGKGKRLGRLRDHPADMVADDRYLYILTQPGGSSANTKVVRMDQRTGRTTGSDRLPDGNAAGIALVDGKVWLVHGQGSAGRISVLEPDSLKLRAIWDIDGFVRSIAANSQGAFVAGGAFNKNGLVIRFNPRTGLEEARRTLPGEFIGTLAVFQDNVIAIGGNGTIWVLSAQDLTIRRAIKLNIGQYNPRGVHPTAAALYITNQQGQGNNGTVLAVRNWQPGGGQQQPDEPPAPSLSLGTWKFDGRISAEQSEGRGVLFSASVEVPSSAGTASFTLSCYPNGKQIELGMLGRERFASLAKSAIKAGQGRFSSSDSYIDLVIDGQPYPLKANFFEANGELNLDRGYRANGRIMTGLLRSSEATLNAARDRITIPLRGSTKAICSALRGCGIVQSHCRAKGQ